MADMAYHFICASEDAFSWLALLCGNHLGQVSAFWSL